MARPKNTSNEENADAPENQEATEPQNQDQKDADANTQESDLEVPINAEGGALVGDPKALDKAAKSESEDAPAISISQLDEVRLENDPAANPEGVNPTGFGENAKFTPPEER